METKDAIEDWQSLVNKPTVNDVFVLSFRIKKPFKKINASIPGRGVNR
jgi:hypothetical protein